MARQTHWAGQCVLHLCLLWGWPVCGHCSHSNPQHCALRETPSFSWGLFSLGASQLRPHLTASPGLHSHGTMTIGLSTSPAVPLPSLLWQTGLPALLGDLHRQTLQHPLRETGRWGLVEESKGTLEAWGRSIFTRHAHTLPCLKQAETDSSSEQELFKGQALTSTMSGKEMSVGDISALGRTTNVFEWCCRLGLVPTVSGGKGKRGLSYGEGHSSVPSALLPGVPALTLLAFPQPRAGRMLQGAACCHCWGKQQQHVQPRNGSSPLSGVAATLHVFTFKACSQCCIWWCYHHLRIQR